MLLHELFESTFSKVNWESRGVKIDDSDYFFGGWIDTSNGHFINEHTAEGNHHIEFILNNLQKFGLTPNDLPETFFELPDDMADAKYDLWREFEKFMDEKITSKGRFVRVYVGSHQEMSLEGTKPAIQKVVTSGLLYKMRKKFSVNELHIDTLNPKQSLTFKFPENKMEFNEWMHS